VDPRDSWLNCEDWGSKKACVVQYGAAKLRNPLLQVGGLQLAYICGILLGALQQHTASISTITHYSC